jgi:ribonuclease D
MSDELRSISRDEINALPIRRWQGEVRVITSAEEAARALAEIREETMTGFDTETRPAFKPGESYLPSLAQIATARAVYLFRLGSREVAAAVAEVLAAERIVKAGVGLADDFKALKKVIEFAEKSTVDLGEVVMRRGFKQSGVRSLAAIFLGFRVPKGSKTSNWARARLTPQQIAYAATDAWTCRELYVRFRTLGFV